MEHVVDKNAASIVSAMQKSKIDAYYKAVAANQTLARVRRKSQDSTDRQVYLKGHPYSNYHPLAGTGVANLIDNRASADLLVQQSQTDLYDKTHIVSRPYKGTPQYSVNQKII